MQRLMFTMSTTKHSGYRGNAGQASIKPPQINHSPKKKKDIVNSELHRKQTNKTKHTAHFTSQYKMYKVNISNWYIVLNIQGKIVPLS